jgi:hypothetical protein
MMERALTGAATVPTGEPVPLQPTVATAWNGFEYEVIPSPASEQGRARLRSARERNCTVWVETLLEELSDDEDAWFDGSFGVWQSMETPRVDWTPMADILDAIGLPTPALAKTEGEPPASSLLRALPYTYTRGVFGTFRDALSKEEVVRKLVDAIPNKWITAFPMAGFVPRGEGSGRHGVEYVLLRTIVGVVGHALITVRLPDFLCTSGPDGGIHRSKDSIVRLVVPRRFLPLRTMPDGRELAEAIGIHQATTVRAVAGQIRDRLKAGEDQARTLDPATAGTAASAAAGSGATRAHLRKEAIGAAAHTDELAEIAQHLDRKIAALLRRLGDQTGDASRGADKLVPPEVERRYGFALDEVRSLHQDCRISAEVVRQALSRDEQRQGERFQFFAALLASAVLVPTLIASIFGASVEVPAEHSRYGFAALLGVIVIFGSLSFYSLWKARSHGWKAPLKEFAVPAIIAIVVVIAFSYFLVNS